MNHNIKDIHHYKFEKNHETETSTLQIRGNYSKLKLWQNVFIFQTEMYKFIVKMNNGIKICKGPKRIIAKAKA